MRRLISALLTAAMLTIPLAAPVTADNDRCTKGDVQGMTKAGGQSAKLALDKGQLIGKGGNWIDCQFRLYDDNDPGPPDDPEVPHVFTTEDWFLAGIFQFMWRDLLDEFGLSRADAIDYLSQLEDRFFWGAEGGPLTEVVLTQTNYRNLSNKDFLGWMVSNHRYHIFEAGSLDAGTYRWRWEFHDPLGFQPDETIHGVVEIVPA